MTRIICLLLLALALASLNGHAQDIRFIHVGGDGTKYLHADDAALGACQSAMNSYYAYPSQYLSNGVFVSQITTWFESQPAGTEITVTCYLSSYSSTVALQIKKIFYCPANVPGDLSWTTTIASLTPYPTGGYNIVGAGVMPNPQCNNGCVVSHVSGGILLMEGFIQAGELPKVGDPLIVLLFDGVKYTGDMCNVPDYPSYTDHGPYPPAGWIAATDGGNSGDGDGENGSGLSTADSQALQQTASNTGEALSKFDELNASLSNVSSNLSIGDVNNESRHQESMARLGQMLDVLGGIKNGTDKIGTGSGTGGIPADGLVLDGGGNAVTAADPTVDNPADLALPGEGHAGFNSLIKLTADQTTRPAGTCPTFSGYVPFLNVDVNIDAHCTLLTDDIRNLLGTIWLALWTIGGLMIVLKA